MAVMKDGSGSLRAWGWIGPPYWRGMLVVDDGEAAEAAFLAEGSAEGMIGRRPSHEQPTRRQKGASEIRNRKKQGRRSANGRCCRRCIWLNLVSGSDALECGSVDETRDDRNVGQRASIPATFRTPIAERSA